MDDFVALVSHELRAPLTNINASVELMEAGAIDDRVRAKLAIVGHEASRLTRLVKGVLDCSRIHAGRFTLHVAPTGADDLGASALRRLPSADRVRGGAPLAPDWPPLLADPGKLPAGVNPYENIEAASVSAWTENVATGPVLVPFATLSLKDGSLGNRPWRQELPDPSTTVVWGPWR